jgi:putative ABC transport system permease protein
MIKNYQLVAIRNFRKGKVFSFINVMGLAVGMTCCFLIMLFVRDELSFDHFQNKLDRLYRITYIPKFAGLDKGLPVLAIFISCLGLLGLIALAARGRTREIGIRKVLGATVPGVVALLSKDFIGLILVSIILATPVTIWIMHRWLMQFAYRIGISWWTIALSAFGMIAIAMLTLCFQAVRAAMANPVHSLRAD